jgi:hypothetical protein
MGTMAGWGKPILARERFECPYLWGQQDSRRRLKKSVGKAAADESTGA